MLNISFFFFSTTHKPGRGRHTHTHRVGYREKSPWRLKMFWQKREMSSGNSSPVIKKTLFVIKAVKESKRKWKKTGWSSRQIKWNYKSGNFERKKLDVIFGVETLHEIWISAHHHHHNQTHTIFIVYLTACFGAWWVKIIILLCLPSYSQIISEPVNLEILLSSPTSPPLWKWVSSILNESVRQRAPLIMSDCFIPFSRLTIYTCFIWANDWERKWIVTSALDQAVS